MDRRSNPRIRAVNLKALNQKNEGPGDRPVGPTQEIIAVALSFRMVFSEQAEIWTVRGIMRDGEPTREDIGELSFVMIPGDEEPATAVTGFISPQPPYLLGLSEEALWQHIRAMVTQLGYDQDGFYASLAIGGAHRYFEEFRRR
jgi:hypothetical protein